MKMEISARDAGALRAPCSLRTRRRCIRKPVQTNLDAHRHDHDSRAPSAAANGERFTIPSQVGGVQSSVTDSQGVSPFPALHPGVYHLDSTLSDSRTVKRADNHVARSAPRRRSMCTVGRLCLRDVQSSGETPVVDIKLGVAHLH